MRKAKGFLVLGVSLLGLVTGVSLVRGKPPSFTWKSFFAPSRAERRAEQEERTRREEARETLPPRKERVRSGLEMVKEVCSLFRDRKTLSLREVAERFGTDLGGDDGIIDFTPRAWIFEPRRPGAPAGAVEGGTHPDHVTRMRLELREDDLMTLQDLIEVFGPVTDHDLAEIYVSFGWEPPSTGPWNCRVSAFVDGLDDPEHSFVSVLIIERGGKSETGEIWPERFGNPPPSIWRDPAPTRANR